MKPGSETTSRHGKGADGREDSNLCVAVTTTLQPPEGSRFAEISQKSLLRATQQASSLTTFVGDALWLEFDRAFGHDKPHSSSGS